MKNFLNFHLVKADFQLLFICCLYGHLQYHFRMEEVFLNHPDLAIQTMYHDLDGDIKLRNMC